MRANPLTGAVLDSSFQIFDDTLRRLNGFFAIDARGTVFFGNRGREHGALFAFAHDLQLKWVDSTQFLGYGSPVLGPHGLLAVSGRDTTLRVYKPEVLNLHKSNFEAPFTIAKGHQQSWYTLKYFVNNSTSPLALSLFNTRGQRINTIHNLPNAIGWNYFHLTSKNVYLPNGTYILNLNLETKSIQKSFTICR